MRSTSLVLLAAGVGSALAHTSQRKSLAHGHALPHAKFVTEGVPRVPRLSSFAPLSPREVAAAHLTGILRREDGRLPVEGVDYFVREDSYEDDKSGVTHLYIRQLVNGLEVADGDISMNIKNGQLLSYGDSFYRGDLPSEWVNEEPAKDLHGTFCAPSDEELFTTQGQTLLGGNKPSTSNPEHVNCNTHHISKRARARVQDFGLIQDPKVAALHFMIAAHPSPQVAHHLESEFDSLFEKMTVSSEAHFAKPGEGVSPTTHIEGLPGAVNPVPAKLVYVQSPSEDSNKLTLAWKLEVEMEDNWYETYMDAFYPSHIHSVVDWASDAAIAPVPKEPETVTPTYRVWKWGINDPSEGKRSLESGFDKIASPVGWHSIPAGKDPLSSNVVDPTTLVNHTSTFGNNVFAHENWEGANQWLNNYRPSADADMVFDYKYGPKSDGGETVVPKDYINLTITQLFYTSNMVHDLFYRYGFDEKAGNFQQENFGRGGRDGDGVIANAQDGSGYNNANFMTPPDGQNGRCRMYVWNTATPYRDGDLEAGIVIHELAHGLSTRITGGPMNSGCLGWGESGGMGEGWGDFIATTARAHKKYEDFPMGAWAANQEGGIRNYPYSTNNTINPSTYKTLDKPGYWGVHAIGEVWAEILWVVEQNLIKKHGWSSTLFPPQPDSKTGVIPEVNDFYRPRKNGKDPLVPKHGNTLLLQLVVDGMKLQPCRPSFFNARDAIIQADEILTGGENKCELWKGFSDRGLGPDATIVGSTPWGGGVRSDDFELPANVC